MEGIRQLLKEKSKMYGYRDTFRENNERSYDNAIGNVREKLREFQMQQNFVGLSSRGKDTRTRILLKAAAWLYLIFEQELNRGQRDDRPRSDSYPQRTRS